MLDEIQVAYLKQLKTSIDNLIDASEDVYCRCGDYSIFDEAVQQETKEMYDFRLMQFKERSRLLLNIEYLAKVIK